MADGLHAGDSVGKVIEKTSVKNYEIVMDYQVNGSENEIASDEVNAYYSKPDSAKLFGYLCAKNGSKHEGLLAACEEDCRKKRCVDRYDSSESSDRYFIRSFKPSGTAFIVVYLSQNLAISLRFCGHCHGHFLRFLSGPHQCQCCRGESLPLS